MNRFLRKVYMTVLSCIVLCVSSAYYLSNGSISILNQPISTMISTIPTVNATITNPVTTVNVGNTPAVTVSNTPNVSLAGVELEEGAIVGIDFTHNNIHSGKTFRVATLNKALADNGFFNITLRPTDNIHFTAQVDSSGKAYLFLYEGITQSAGVAVTPTNMARHKTRVAGTRVTVNATVNQSACEAATLIGMWIINGGTTPTGVGNGVRSGSEYILKTDTEYVLRLQNVSGGAKDCVFDLQWYTED